MNTEETKNEQPKNLDPFYFEMQDWLEAIMTSKNHPSK